MRDTVLKVDDLSAGYAGTIVLWQVSFAVAPGEVLTRGGQKIKATFKTNPRLFLGLTHNSLGYAVPSDEWNKAPNGKRYEESISPTPTFGDTVITTIQNLAGSDSCT